ncbi:MAG TPA: cyclic pyranopterin monophosphate synthase MoaC [Bacteroidales bacterium]|nr:cyclic pyranopterin monophosphate synthase MoaC [Bacteroidales bacterium]
MKELSHTNASGKARMVDVAGKSDQVRTATAQGFIRLQPETVALIRNNEIIKGDVLTVAEIAGVMAGKKTSELIPLCHPLAITKMEVTAEIAEDGVKITALARCTGKTGIEMEAITAVSIALVTIYDMCKAVDKEMLIGEIRLISKTKE